VTYQILGKDEQSIWYYETDPYISDMLVLKLKINVPSVDFH